MKQDTNTGLKKIRIKQYASFIICLLLMLVVPIWRDHRIIGINLPDPNKIEKIETIKPTESGIIINTTEIGKDIMGYGGPTPVEITVSNGKITKITPLKNQETPEFYGAVRNSNILESFDGLTLPEAIKKPVDGVSGATYSSKAIIGNIRAGIEYALKSDNIVTIEKLRNVKNFLQNSMSQSL